MTQAQAGSIINALAMDFDTGILETLEYMRGIYDEGLIEWNNNFSLEQRQAYWIVTEGMRELFFG